MKTEPEVKRLEISSEEWEVHDRFQKVSAEKKLEWLDGMRAFLFEVWKCNPDLFKEHEWAKEQGY